LSKYHLCRPVRKAIINGFTALFALMLFMSFGVVSVASAQTTSCTASESDPIVEVVRSSSFHGLDSDAYAQQNYDDFVGTISNPNFRRFWDGTCGSYKVPVRIVAPKTSVCHTGRLAHVGVIELIHPNSIGYDPPGAFSGIIHGWNDPTYDPLIDQGFMEAWANLRAPFLFGDPSHGGGGAIYVGFQANNFDGELDYVASLPANNGLGLHLDRPQDYAILYRDVSKWLRQTKTPQNFVNSGRSNLCSVSEVIGFGYSVTANRLKAVISNPNRLNSTWGTADPVFQRGRALDGVLLGGLFGKPKRKLFDDETLAGLCPDVTSSVVSHIACEAPTEPVEGPVVVIRSEADIQILFGTTLRPGAPNRYEELDHYKVHEIASTSHLEIPYFALGPLLESFGLDPSLSRQNPLDRSPILRADLVNLLNKIRTYAPLPNSKFIEARAPNSRSALAIVSLDFATGNGLGGISLPQAAAPLGFYRGTDCHGLNTDFDSSNAYHYALPPLGRGDILTGQANYVLETAPGTPYRICEFNGQFLGGDFAGMFTPYKVVDDATGSSFCRSLYPTRQAYSNRVAVAANLLIGERLILPEERAEIIAAAETEADKYPECVPAR